MEFIDIDFNDDKDLKNIVDKLNKNHTISLEIVKEINKFEKENEQSIDVKEEEIIETNSTAEESNLQFCDEEFENEVDYYFSQLDSLSDKTNLEEEISNILPSSKKNNFEKLILRLKLELLKNIKEINNLINEERKTIEIEDLKDLKEEILFEQLKLEILDKKIIDINNNLDNEKIEENNLIFIPTSGGNIRILEELEKIDQEYYDGFLGLFNSIKDGTLKNVKKFNNNNSKSTGVSEVKDNKIRVVFDRIGKNDFAVITAFTKKCDNNKGYLVPLELKVKNYINQRETIKMFLDDEDFKKQNKNYEMELFNILNNVDSNTKILRREK